MPYHFFSKILHWLIAILIFFSLGLGWYLTSLDYYSANLQQITQIHQTLGLLVLFLSALFLICHFVFYPSALDQTVKLWKKIASKMVHNFIFVLLFLLPLSGLIFVTANGDPVILINGWDISIGFEFNANVSALVEESHAILAYVITVLVFFHILAALKHHFWDKDDVLKRML